MDGFCHFHRMSVSQSCCNQCMCMPYTSTSQVLPSVQAAERGYGGPLPLFFGSCLFLWLFDKPVTRSRFHPYKQPSFENMCGSLYIHQLDVPPEEWLPPPIPDSKKVFPSPKTSSHQATDSEAERRATSTKEGTFAPSMGTWCSRGMGMAPSSVSRCFFPSSVCLSSCGSVRKESSRFFW